MATGPDVQAERLRQAAMLDPLDLEVTIPGRVSVLLDVAGATRVALDAGVPADAVWYACSRTSAYDVDIALTAPLALLLVEQLRSIAAHAAGKDTAMLVDAAKATKALLDALDGAR